MLVLSAEQQRESAVPSSAAQTLLVYRLIVCSALPMPDEPLLSWSVYLADAPAKWLGTVEAPTAEEAVKIGAEKFGHDAKRLMAVRRR